MAKVKLFLSKQIHHQGLSKQLRGQLIRPPQASHIWYKRMQGCAAGWEPSWCRPNLECHRSLAPVNNVHMAVSPLLWRGLGKHPRITIPTRVGYCSNINWARRFRCEDNNLTNVYGLLSNQLLFQLTVVQI